MGDWLRNVPTLSLFKQQIRNVLLISQVEYLVLADKIVQCLLKSLKSSEL